MADLQKLLAGLSPDKRALLAQRLKDREGRGSAKGQITADVDNRYEPFPLTDLQQAYWIGRAGIFDVGEVATHAYLEIEGQGLSVEQLQDALRRTIDRHDMLRAVIGSGEAQQVLADVPAYVIQSVDATGMDEAGEVAAIASLRGELSHQVLSVERWPLFDIRAITLDRDRVRLFVSLDALIFDARSIYLLLNEWANEYFGVANAPPPPISFRDYVLHQRETVTEAVRARDAAYWRERVVALPPAPPLPTVYHAAEPQHSVFVRRQHRIDRERWQRIKDRAAQHGLTTTGVLLAAYADVISYWSQSRHFTLSVPQFNRDPIHPSVGEVVGEFASFTLLEIDNRPSDGFAARAKRHQERLWEDLEHATFSGVQVLRELAKDRGSAGSATMPVIFTALPLSESVREAAERFGELTYSINQSSQVWLDNHVGEYHGELTMDWDSVDTLFPPQVSEDMLEAFVRCLHTLADDPASWNCTLTELATTIVPSAHLARRDGVNGREAAIPDVLAHQLFETQALGHPDHIAIVTQDRRMTYAEVLRLARQWGRRLRREGVSAGSIVAIVMEKGWEQVVGTLGVLFAGGAYAPLDPDNPPERLHRMIADATPVVVLTQTRMVDQVAWPDGVTPVCIDIESVSTFDDTELDAVQTPDDLGYLLYTSGSTGTPKGVMIRHRGMVNAIVQTNERFDIGSNDAVLALTALHHDMSIFDIFGVLGAGGTIVMPEAAQRRDPAHWADLMRRERVTVWNSVPAMMEMLLEFVDGKPGIVPASLRWVFLGGDWIQVTVPDRLKNLVPGAQLVSVGGPTETTLWNIWHVVEPSDAVGRSIPYGSPIANTSYHILHEDLTPCPDWVSGEMYVSGVGVSAGYWKDDDATSRKFVTLPGTQERLYKTGDTGCYRPDGVIEFRGRADFQVKIQGQRIELGEVEAAIQRQADVQAAVVGITGERHGRQLLAAYVVPKPGCSINEPALRRDLAAQLLPYMMPAFIIPMEALPLTPNGKVHRQALPDPTTVASIDDATSTGEPPSERMTQILKIVRNVLDAADIGPTDNLLAFGANSIDMVKIGNRLEEGLGSRPRIDELFRLQTVEALSGFYTTVADDAGREPSGGQTYLTTDANVEALIKDHRVLLEPAERDAFKASQPGRRRFDQEQHSVPLARITASEAMLLKRKSYRQFSLRPLSGEAMGQLLGHLAQQTREAGTGFFYPSPGGLYPTQVYVHVKPGRVTGLNAGTYYYDPVAHQLVELVAGVDLNRDIHIPFINTPIFDEAAFSLFLITQIKAIAPGYGERSLHFATLEAGCIAMLLEMVGPALGIGLCQIGGIDFAKIRHLFDLDEGHVLIHSMLGGGIGEAHEKASPEMADREAARASQLVDRIKSLTPEELKTMLDAQRSARREGGGS